MEHAFSDLPVEDQQALQKIFAGETLPPLYADIIAKTIYNADVHPDRLNFFLRSIAKDETIDVVASASNEAFRKSIYSKGMVSDIPSWLKERRLSDIEVQKAAQDFIFTRADLYASNMLLLQYSVSAGQAKRELGYPHVNEALLVILMVKSPKPFRIFDKESERYIHRFIQMTADTGLTYPTKAKVIYVQLDKCLSQFKRGINAETLDQRPDRLQTWLAMIADVNDEDVKNAAEKDEELHLVRKEIQNMAQDKEVQNMLIQEDFERMDWLTYGSEMEATGKAIGKAIGLSTGKIIGTVETMRDEGRSDTAIITRLMTKYGLTKEQAEEYVLGEQVLT